MPKIDEAANPPNARMHAWAKRRAIDALTDGSALSTYTYSCWHVVTTAHGGEFRALWRIFLGALKRRAEKQRTALEIWCERTFWGKTDADYDRECEEFAAWLQGLDRAATPPKLFEAKAAFKEQYGETAGVEGFGIGRANLRVYVRDEGVRAALPAVFRGLPVEYIVTGEIKAL